MHLANGGTIVVDNVIVTSGHTANQQLQDRDRARVLEPYPVGSYADTIPTEATVAVAGMGLVAIDVVTALTVGSGGSFIEQGNRLRYRPSGREPKLQLFCRSGLPVHRQVGHRPRSQRCVQAADLHRRATWIG